MCFTIGREYYDLISCYEYINNVTPPPILTPENCEYFLEDHDRVFPYKNTKWFFNISIRFSAIFSPGGYGTLLPQTLRILNIYAYMTLYLVNQDFMQILRRYFFSLSYTCVLQKYIFYGNYYSPHSEIHKHMFTLQQ